MGIRQTSPTFATFTVKPRLGSMASAAIKVPTLRGCNATSTLFLCDPFVCGSQLYAPPRATSDMPWVVPILVGS